MFNYELMAPTLSQVKQLAKTAANKLRPLKLSLFNDKETSSELRRNVSDALSYNSMILQFVNAAEEAARVAAAERNAAAQPIITQNSKDDPNTLRGLQAEVEGGRRRRRKSSKQRKSNRGRKSTKRGKRGTRSKRGKRTKRR